MLSPTSPGDEETFAYPPPQMPSYNKESILSPSFSSRVNPAILLVIVIMAVVFFVCGLVHLLIRFLMRKPSFSIYQSNRFVETSNSHVLQRQLQQLFRLHDSGLDRACIDAFPVFYYKDITGLKEPSDCPVCLCEFSGHDKLRLLPACSHAFHIECIDTWLLSNSTCPLCRGTLENSGLFTLETQISSITNSREPRDMLPCDAEDVVTSVGKRVFSVRLGKFRRTYKGPEDGIGMEIRKGEGSSRILDPRRCYSMGSYQYVVGDFDLQVTLSPNQNRSRVESKFCVQIGDEAGERNIRRSRGDSFSTSKIWLWSNSKNNNRIPEISDICISMPQCNVTTQMQNHSSA